jgi:hypothetical protein
MALTGLIFVMNLVGRRSTSVTVAKMSKFNTAIEAKDHSMGT